MTLASHKTTPRFNVTVDGQAYDDIMAIGVGHIQGDLVIVHPNPAKPHQPIAEELGSTWQTLTIARKP